MPAGAGRCGAFITRRRQMPDFAYCPARSSVFVARLEAVSRLGFVAWRQPVGRCDAALCRGHDRQRHHGMTVASLSEVSPGHIGEPTPSPLTVSLHGHCVRVCPHSRGSCRFLAQRRIRRFLTAWRLTDASAFPRLAGPFHWCAWLRSCFFAACRRISASIYSRRDLSLAADGDRVRAACGFGRDRMAGSRALNMLASRRLQANGLPRRSA